ncbi:glutathione S-transferase family protein [Rubellimicrobium arenae]|uniref:glutathione S-transferase family protein n=1 Tax=Rubellimicrobium arenae TaxID=2817372 RepID=UPI001B306234|nr:glutathione S-transferase family protein [Rubellimicrobium arenae]
MPQLYNYDLDENCYRVRLVAACIGLPLDLHGVDAFPGREHQSAPMLALNPLGRLPILRDGDLVLTQPEAILLHLAERHDPQRRFVTDDPVRRARMMEWLIFAARDLSMAVAARTTSMLGEPGDTDALRAGARRCLRIMDDHMTRQSLAGSDFFVGPEATLADLALFPAFALSRDFNVDHDEFPALRLWARRLRSLPGFITMPGLPDYH